jgi:hypothetical protein
VRQAVTGAVVGVSTVGLKPGPGGRPLYHFLMFLRREHRQPYLMREVTNGTRDFLRGFRHPRADPAGMLIVTENRKLVRAGIRRCLARHGYDHRGRTPAGLDVWLAPF